MADENSSKAFSERLKLCVNKHGDIRKVSKALGISPASVSKWVSGDAEPKRSNLVALAQALNVNLLWLASGKGPMRGDQISTSKEAIIESDHKARRKPLNISFHGRILKKVQSIYKECGINASIETLGEVTADIHNELMESYNDIVEQQIALTVLLNRLRKELDAQQSQDVDVA